VNGAKSVAQNQAKLAVQEQLDKLQPEIKRQIKDQFDTPVIEQVVHDQAKLATETTANKIIRLEVDQQVSAAVATEQENIRRILKSAADGAVAAVKGDIQAEADKATRRIVDDRVEPELRTLTAYTGMSSWLVLAQNGDGEAFDKIVNVANDKNQPPTLRRTAASSVEAIKHDPAHTGVQPNRYSCSAWIDVEGAESLGAQVGAQISALQSNNYEKVMSALECFRISAILGSAPTEGPRPYFPTPREEPRSDRFMSCWMHSSIS
jgi:hypothetical protein